MKSLPSQHNKNNNLLNKTVLLIILIILFVILLFIINSCKNDNIPLIPTGNVDIFDLNCICPEGKKCDEENVTSPNVNSENNNVEERSSTIQKEEASSIQEEASSITNPYEYEEKIEGFNIFDNQIHWELESKLRIFSHPAYEFNNIIAPGSKNTYEFRVRNNNSFAVAYSIDFLEDNDANINMKYRLKRNGKYIKGDDQNWVSYESLKTSSIILNNNEYDSYLLDWQWIEGTYEEDTALGLMNDIGYTLSIEIVGVEYEKN